MSYSIDKNHTKEFKIKIGRTVISVISNKYFQSVFDNLSDNFNFGLFKSDDNPDIVLKLYHNKNSHFLSKDKIYCVPGFENIYDLGEDKYSILLNGEHGTNNKTRMVEFNLKSGEIYYISQKYWFDKNRLSIILNLILRDYLSYSINESILIHACGINDNGQGILFVGHSGAGKSTMANLWKDKKGTTILSDEAILISKIKNEFWMYGTPWSSEDNCMVSPKSSRLDKIFYIKHGEDNILIKKKTLELLLMLLNDVRSWPPTSVSISTIDFLKEVIMNTPCYELSFVPNKRIIDFVENVDELRIEKIKS